MLLLLAARFSGLDGKASLVVSGALQLLEGSGEASKRGFDLLGGLMGDMIIGGSSMVAKSNQKGRVRVL